MTEYNKHSACTASRPRVSSELVERETSPSLVCAVLQVQTQETEGWRSAKVGKKPRRRYSESEEYDSDTDSERQDCILWSQQ